MSAALPGREIMNPPKLKLENRNSKKTASLLLVSDGLTGTRGGNEFPKQALRERIFQHALRMPLNADDPVGFAGPLDALDDAVGCIRCHRKFLTGQIDCLVMTAIDFRCGRSIQSGKSTIRYETCSVFGVAFPLSRREICVAVCQRFWFPCANVLNQRTLQIDIQALAPVANGSDRVTQSEGTLQDREVRFLPI